jgi:hypothetical protein
MAQYRDHTDSYRYNAEVRFYSVSQNKLISFKSFIKNFSDKYECNWSEARAFGRMDPLMTYQGTGRKITLEWDIPSYSLEEAKANHARCSALIQAMYPRYSSKEGSTMETPPYFKIKFMNLITNARVATAGNALETGLFGTIAGFEYNPDFDAGVFYQGGKIYPKLIIASVEITALHDHTVGAGSTEIDFNTFPYGEKWDDREFAEHVSTTTDLGMTTEPIQMTPSAGFSGDFGGEFAGGHFETEQQGEISSQASDTVLGE